MPYIANSHRETIDDNIDLLVSLIRLHTPPNKLAGTVNYVISRVSAGSLKPDTGWTYDDINKLIGVLECAKEEFYRRVAAPYEDLARKKNGDIKEYAY